jgi:hypothetical protein
MGSLRDKIAYLRYTLELRTQLALFGIGITKSLERTMGHYLQVSTEPLHLTLNHHLTDIIIPTDIGYEWEI